MRKVEFVAFNTDEETDYVMQLFEKAGFYAEFPDQCFLRCGTFLLRDPARRTFVVVVCRNNNDSVVWQ